MINNTELTDFDQSLNILLQRHLELTAENELLRKKLAKTLQKTATLLNHKNKIATKIKQIITQIRDEQP
ncbi:MAG: hypothetical protein A2X78_00910 [Gammaproteobacteria bacterium GWE2_37_16]|nr:MAG: hypothetical protein A2X78_00910 [Gammaproteobacteria bacterium GWE2_37_16]